MPVSQNSIILKTAIIILVCGLLLTGCVPGGGRFAPDGWAGPVISGNTLYVVSKDQSKLLALDLSDNRNVLWKFAPEPEYVGGGFGCAPVSSSNLLAYGNPAVDGEMVYIASYDGVIYAINSGSATREYSLMREYEMKKEKPKPKDVAITDGEKELGDLVDMGLITKDQRQQIKDRLGIEDSPGSDLSWVDLGVDRNIITEDQATDIKETIKVRGVRWAHDTDEVVVSNPVIAGNVLVVASGNKLNILDIRNGTELLQPFKADGEIWGNPVISDGKVYFGTLDHKMYCVGLENGNEVWEKEFGGAIASTPLIVDNTLYIGTFENEFYALDASSGEPKWPQPFEAQNWFYTTPIYYNGVIFVGSLDHNIYAINAATGQAEWSHPFGTGEPIRSAPVIVDDILIVASKDGYVYGLNPETGMQEWPKQYVEKKVLADICTEDSIVYVLNHDDTLYALNAENGNQLWKQSLDVE